MLPSLGTSVTGKYNVLCPRGTEFDLPGDITVQDIMLKSQKPTLVPMEILECRCFKDNTHDTYFKFVRGPNGEVYEVAPPENLTPWKKAKTMLTITRCVDIGSFYIHDVSEIEHALFQSSSQQSR